MALCGDRGAGGASARSQRAPARSRARERVLDQAWVSSRGVRREHEERSWRGANTTAKFQGDKKVSGMPNVAREPERMGWCDAHAEGSGATSEGSGKVAGRRGSHNDSTLASGAGWPCAAPHAQAHDRTVILVLVKYWWKSGIIKIGVCRHFLHTRYPRFPPSERYQQRALAPPGSGLRRRRAVRAALGDSAAPFRWHTRSMDGRASGRLLVFPSRLVPQCHGWRRSPRHMCSLCSSCAPLAEGLHHTRWPSTTGPYHPAPPGRRDAVRAGRRR